MEGRLISLSPARGTLDSRRRSLQVFDSLMATRLRTPERGRVDVAGTLAQIDVFVRMQTGVIPLDPPQKFKRQVSDDLVGVYIRRGARPSLNYIDRKLIVMFACAQRLAGRHYRLGTGLVKQPQLVIGEGGRLLDAGQRLDQLGVIGDRRFSNQKILNGTQGVYTVVGVRRQCPIAQHIMLFPGG